MPPPLLFSFASLYLLLWPLMSHAHIMFVVSSLSGVLAHFVLYGVPKTCRCCHDCCVHPAIRESNAHSFTSNMRCSLTGRPADGFVYVLLFLVLFFFAASILLIVASSISRWTLESILPFIMEPFSGSRIHVSSSFASLRCDAA